MPYRLLRTEPVTHFTHAGMQHAGFRVQRGDVLVYCCDIGVELFNFQLRADIDSVVVLRIQPDFGRLAILRHHDERRLQCGYGGERQVEQDKREWIEQVTMRARQQAVSAFRTTRMPLISRINAHEPPNAATPSAMRWPNDRVSSNSTLVLRILCGFFMAG